MMTATGRRRAGDAEANEILHAPSVLASEDPCASSCDSNVVIRHPTGIRRDHRDRHLPANNPSDDRASPDVSGEVATDVVNDSVAHQGA